MDNQVGELVALLRKALRNGEASYLEAAYWLHEHDVVVRPKTGCYDCGREYGNEHGFPDLVVPNKIWDTISPTGDSGGLLCPSCTCKRAHDWGLEHVRATFESGPLYIPDIPPADSECLKEPLKP